MSSTKNNFSFKHFKNDFPAALVVWLVALPLCIGIAKGSEVNAFSGLIAGIIGGIVVTIFSGSKFGVSGPAAGLITIVVAGIATFNGNLEVFFLAVFLSGIIQFLLGLFRLGVIGYFVPTSVINGMLASIGLILILKQFPLIFGGYSESVAHDQVYKSYVEGNGVETTIITDKDMLNVNIKELDMNGVLVKNGYDFDFSFMMKSIEYDTVKENLIGLKRKDQIEINPYFFSHINTDDLNSKLESQGIEFEDFSDIKNNSLLTVNEIIDLPDIHLVYKIWLDTKAALLSVSKGALIVFLISIFIMLLWEQNFMKKRKIFQYLPGSLVAVIFGSVIAYWFNSSDALNSFSLVKQQLVSLPVELKAWDFKNLIKLPDFTALANPNVWVVAVTIAIVGSIETLLSVEATDKLDPDKNISPTNKELKAQGIGNAISGLIGGLPITMVIVRSSANINAKAKTQLSAIYHGILLLMSVFTFPHLLEMIPSASLAAILCVLGFKLLKLKKVIEMFKTDTQGAIVIVVTIAAVLATDLLKGVGVGFALAMFFILRKNYVLAFIDHWDEQKKELTISFSQIVSFLNKGALMQKLQNVPEGAKVKMSAKKCHTMSKEIQEVIVDFRDITSKTNNIDLDLIGFEKFELISGEEE